MQVKHPPERSHDMAYLQMLSLPTTRREHAQSREGAAEKWFACSLHAVLRMVLTLEGTLAWRRATNCSDNVLIDGLLEEEAGFRGAATGRPW